MVRQVLAVVLAEGELQHLHAGKPEDLDEAADVLREKAEVLGDERDVSERVLDRHEEHEARPVHPAPVARGGRARGHLPVRREAAEVVEAHDVREPEVQADPLDPPVVAFLGENVPPVEGMAPELPVRAEVVGRNARRRRGPPVLAEHEQPAVRPDVGAVARDVDGEVPDHRDVARVRLRLHALPLPEKEELRVRVERDLVRELGPRRGEGALLAVRESGIPFRPGPARVLFPQGGEEGPVGEPRGVRRGLREPGDLVQDAPAERLRVAERVLEKAAAERHDALPVHAPLGNSGAPSRAPAGRRPSSTSHSGETRSGSPAKAESPS